MRSALITGVGGTLGSSVFERLERDGYRVHGWMGDVTNALLVARDAQRLGAVDALICCAGSIDDCWRVNVMGTIQACKYVDARNIITIAGGGVGGPDLMRENHPYVVSKFAVAGFTESVAPELARQGSVINCVSPGPFRSAMNPTSDGTPDRAVELIAWLASEECKVTGRMFGAQHWKKGEHGRGTQVDSMRVGIIGYGSVGRKRHAALGGDTLAAVYDTHAVEWPADAGVCTHVEDMWPLVDAVIVSTPNKHLVPYAVQAIKAGKHVLIEKPGARKSASLEEVQRLALSKGVTVHVGYNLRFHPAIMQAKAEIGSERITDMRAFYGHGGGGEGWRKEEGDTVQLDLGSHLADFGYLVQCGRLSHLVLMGALGASLPSRVDDRHQDRHRPGPPAPEPPTAPNPSRSPRPPSTPPRVTTTYPGPDGSWAREWLAFKAEIAPRATQATSTRLSPSCEPSAAEAPGVGCFLEVRSGAGGYRYRVFDFPKNALYPTMMNEHNIAMARWAKDRFFPEKSHQLWMLGVDGRHRRQWLRRRKEHQAAPEYTGCAGVRAKGPIPSGMLICQVRQPEACTQPGPSLRGHAP